MSRLLSPPRDLNEYEYFVITCDQVDNSFVLVLSDGQSYELGEAQAAKSYLDRAIGPNLGDRALDTAYNFITAQVVPVRDLVKSFDVNKGPSESQYLFNQKEDNVFEIVDV